MHHNQQQPRPILVALLLIGMLPMGVAADRYGEPGSTVAYGMLTPDRRPDRVDVRGGRSVDYAPTPVWRSRTDAIFQAGRGNQDESVRVIEPPIGVTVRPDIQEPNAFRITLTNTAAQGISAYRLDLSAGETPARSYLYDNYFPAFVPGSKYFEPGETMEVTMSRRRGESDLSLRVGVAFADRTAAGDEAAIQAIFDRRARDRNELRQWLDDLRATLNGPSGVSGLASRVSQARAAGSHQSAMIEGLLGDLAGALGNTSGADSKDAAERILMRFERRFQALTEHAVRRQ